MAPIVKRSLLGSAASLMLLYMAWEFYMLQPSSLEEYPVIFEPLNMEILGSLSDWEMPNRRPEFSDLPAMKTLDPAFLPDYEQSFFSFRRRRLVFIGDVHGCFDELEELLRKISLTRRDHLIFTGDMINKGPQSGKVVDLARQLGASCVQGNHEDRILLIRTDLQSRGILDSGSVNAYDLPAYDWNDRQLARSLADDQAAWLQECPAILKIGQVKDMGEVVVVHGGLHPAVPLEQQELTSVMSTKTTFYRAFPWFRVYNQLNMLLLQGSIVPAPPYTNLTTVIYGGQSFEIRQYTKGLNSGCVHGGDLTALIIEDGGKSQVVQVRCKKHVQS
ncbi:hypothetical protein EYB25_005739 [Talaromyces marneffei]|nr:uncharacterized protein EYB26_006967 [Talaromyces marneffei]KAE8551849.1 hypothetical protein EYB25_005739 [Talaromyces marneffei]QGA19278.1 hypothetical protein EYB26_006967 [Talaromyces marneffei]